MQTVVINTLPPFGQGNANGAFTLDAYPLNVNDRDASLLQSSETPLGNARAARKRLP